MEGKEKKRKERKGKEKKRKERKRKEKKGKERKRKEKKRMMYLLAVLALYLWSVEGQNLNEKNVCNFILAGYPVAYPVDVCATITTSVSAKFACLGGEGYVYEYSDASCTKISLNFSASGYVYNCAGSSSCPYFDVTTWYSRTAQIKLTLPPPLT